MSLEFPPGYPSCALARFKNPYLWLDEPRYYLTRETLMGLIDARCTPPSPCYPETCTDNLYYILLCLICEEAICFSDAGGRTVFGVCFGPIHNVYDVARTRAQAIGKLFTLLAENFSNFSLPRHKAALWHPSWILHNFKIRSLWKSWVFFLKRDCSIFL